MNPTAQEPTCHPWRRLLAVLFAMMMPGMELCAETPPTRVVSVNLCTDQLLLLLAKPGQVAAVSRLAREPNSSFMAQQALEHRVNDGKIEQLLGLQPDLVLASEYSPRPLIDGLRKLGYRVEVFPMATRLDGIRRAIRRMADLVGNRSGGEVIIHNMDRRIKEIAARIRGPRALAIFYQPRGYTSGHNTLQDEALSLAGWRNLAAEQGIEGYASIGLERLLHGEPEQIFTSAYAPQTDSLAQRQLRHPVLQRITRGRPIVNIDYRHWICGGPMIADAIEALAAER